VAYDQETDLESSQPLRLWPGVAAVALQWLFWLAVPLIPGQTVTAMLGGMACGVAAFAWWILFSRAPWLERIGVVVLMVAAVAATSRLVHESISNGMMGMMLPIYSIPALSLALVAGIVVARGRSAGRRRAAIVGAVAIACGVFVALRTDGIRGEGDSDLKWRWTPTAEERLLAQALDEPLVSPPAVPAAPPPAPAAAAVPDAAPPAAPAAASTSAGPDLSVKSPATNVADAPREEARVTADPAARVAHAAWPGFRGPARDGVIRGLRIATDWTASPPRELWRRPVGPGWSSFAIAGDLVFTQEQRGDDEIVSAYALTNGEPVWMHRDAARFWESNGGAGPRATPAFHDGRLYTLGATGILNALDASTGRVLWSRNVSADTGAENPGWGFAGSPLVVGDLVIIAASGRLAGYRAATGEPRWLGPEGGAGYSSPHLATIDGVPQVLLLRGSRTISVSPEDGALLWEHVWDPGVSIVQPAFTAEGDVLIAAGDAMGGQGIRRVAVRRGPGGWTVAERWTTRGLKPYYNDFIVHAGHAYGFDGSILACIDLADGARAWKGGRYGSGQLVALPDQDLLLVVAEDGTLALVAAAPDGYTEVARFKAIEGKTWNHAAMAGDVLLVRNGEEMAAFRLTPAGEEIPRPAGSDAAAGQLSIR
jgi:outer membrane protein assembly factor BamB